MVVIVTVIPLVGTLPKTAVAVTVIVPATPRSMSLEAVPVQAVAIIISLQRKTAAALTASGVAIAIDIFNTRT